MATTQKAIAFQRALQQNLEKRFAGVSVTSSFSTESGFVGAPVITVAGIAIIRITPEASINTDVLGLAQTVYTPHIVQVLIDANATTIPTYGVWALKLFGEACLLGVKVEFYSNNTLAEAQIVAGNLQSTFDNLQYPLMATV